MESNCYDILDSLPLSDDAGRKHTVLLIGMARKFKSAMEDYVKTGEMSVERLQVLLNIKEEKK